MLRAAHDLLASCPTSLYLIHTQPNAHASDLRDPQTGRCAAPSLCAAAAPAGGRRGVVQTTFGVAEVVGDVISAAELREYIEVACARAGREHSVAITQLDALPREDEERRDAVLRAGMFFFSCRCCPLTTCPIKACGERLYVNGRIADDNSLLAW